VRLENKEARRGPFYTLYAVHFIYIAQSEASMNVEHQWESWKKKVGPKFKRRDILA
jgi:hypothetical protein